jgi:hypothetical protein
MAINDLISRGEARFQALVAARDARFDTSLLSQRPGGKPRHRITRRTLQRQNLSRVESSRVVASIATGGRP